MNKRGQVSYEAIFAFGVVLLVFVIILSILSVRQVDEKNTRDFLENKRECLKLSNEISNIYVLGDRATGSVKMFKQANISNGMIVVGNYLCNACCNFTNGTLSNFNIPVGSVSLENSKGSVRITTATEGGQSGPTNSTVFYDGFENWGSGNCAHNSIWTTCNQGDGNLQRSTDSQAGSYSVRFDDHDADTDILIKCVDLSSYTNAYVTFQWKKSGLDGGEYGRLDINTSSSPYTQIFDSGTGSSSYAQQSMDITAYRSSITCLKFHSLANAGGDQFFVDEFRIIGQS